MIEATLFSAASPNPLRPLRFKIFLSANLTPRSRIPLQELLDAAHIHIRKIRLRPAPLNHANGIVQFPSQRTQQCQCHHGCPVHSRGAVDVQLRPGLIQRFNRKLHSALKHFRLFRLEVIIHRIPQHLDPVRLRQRRVIKLDLHVDHMGNAGPRHCRHVLLVPDPTSDRDPAGYPCHIHALIPVPGRKPLIQKSHRAKRRSKPRTQLHVNPSRLSPPANTKPKASDLTPELLILPNHSPPLRELRFPRPLAPLPEAMPGNEIYPEVFSPGRCHTRALSLPLPSQETARSPQTDTSVVLHDLWPLHRLPRSSCRRSSRPRPSAPSRAVLLDLPDREPHSPALSSSAASLPSSLPSSRPSSPISFHKMISVVRRQCSSLRSLRRMLFSAPSVSP